MRNTLAMSGISQMADAVNAISILGTKILALYLIAGAISIGSDSAHVRDVLAFDGIPRGLHMPIVWLVALTEVCLGHCVLFGWANGWALRAVFGLLILYIAQLSYLFIFPESPSCGCPGLIGAMISHRANHGWGIVCNTLFLLCVWQRLLKRSDQDTTL
jgi:hypothetical protein